MKRETREYNYDWNIWTILENAALVCDGTPKEYRSLLSCIPHFGSALDIFIRQGEPGIRFIRLVSQYIRNCITARERGKKTALTSFSMATPILYALDIVPICLEAFTIFGTVVLKRGTGEFLDYCCEIGFTETSCSSQRGALGAYLSGLATRPDMIVCNSPGWCDSNANSYAFASAYLGIPFYQLNYPSEVSGKRSSDYHRQDYRHLISFLEGHTGTRIDTARLGSIIDETMKQDELINELSDLQMLVPNPVPNIYDLMIYGAKSCANGLPELTVLLSSMVDRCRENAVKGLPGNSTAREKARGMFCYIDHYTTDARLWDWMDANDISHLGSILCRYWQADAPYAGTHDGEGYRLDKGSLDSMIDTLADMTARMPMVKQIRGPYDAPQMWLDDNLRLARLLKADFVVYFSTVGCRNTWGAVKLLVRDLEKQGLPSLMLFLDAFDDRVMSWDAVTDRISEFIHVRGIA
ncbi:MAG TPA: 2-hydroxyacyl-CoA dehydratase family protein [Deltaproteobacteria bacterium]|nr:2-hydroxyacyl-CoA dehydratase family protein [Deltaproteobacteria bacterium]HPR54534.1 2-hydroxyacyl-CoA dehydratase family protein [Deltaproteobacteria bacterium]